MTSEEVQREFFEKLARRYDRRFCRSRWPRNQEVKARLIGDVLGESMRAGPVVEIGCGTGQVAANLLDRFPRMHYLGLDLSPGMLSVARQRLQRFEDRVELSVTKSDDVQERGDGFAAAYGIDVLHHVGDPPSLLRRLRSTLHGGAPIVFLEANPIFPITAFMGLAQREERGVFRITATNLERWYEQAGFVQVEVTLGPLYTPPGPRSIRGFLDGIDGVLARTPLLRNLALFYSARARAPIQQSR